MASLVIFAAGLAHRFGGDKQWVEVGPHGERLLDYTLYDAQKAGFTNVLFVIREEDQSWVDRVIKPRWSTSLQISTVFQSIEDSTIKRVSSQQLLSRKKPWGTGHALLTALRVMDTPFFVANADDYYGPKAWVQASRALNSLSSSNIDAVMITYPLESTLSDHGGVSRGVCVSDERNRLLSIQEYEDICLTEEGIRGKHAKDGGYKVMDPMDQVSMNLIGFRHGLLPHAESVFESFVQSYNPAQQEECLITDILEDLLSKNMKVMVEPTLSQWMGLTRKQDMSKVMDRLLKAHQSDIYPNDVA
ncbi:MAG: NTP transferase domain-containing protein [Balneolaceae bacterium]|nr:NTP transferase domain-containing protein [Balneolaceae bacterium]